jgi:hypothetical protein
VFGCGADADLPALEPAVRIRTVLVSRRVELGAFDAAVAFQEQLFGEPARLRLDLLDGRLRIAQVAAVLFTATDPSLQAQVPVTDAVYVVTGLAEFAAHLERLGAVLEQPVTAIPTGSNMLVRHPDGSLVEYVEHARPDPRDDALSLSPAGAWSGSAGGADATG